MFQIKRTVQQFKCMIEEQREKGSEILKGMIVTTSSFSSEAIESASLNNIIELVDLYLLYKLHNVASNPTSK